MRCATIRILLALASTPAVAASGGIQFDKAIAFRSDCAGGRIVVTIDKSVGFRPWGSYELRDRGAAVEVVFARGAGRCEMRPDFAVLTIAPDNDGAPAAAPAPQDSASGNTEAAKRKANAGLAGRLQGESQGASTSRSPAADTGKATITSVQPKQGVAPIDVVSRLSSLGLVGTQVGSAVEVKDLLANYSVNLSIPDSPGLQIVGLGTEDVVRPASPRALAAALQPAVDKDGKVQRGLAVSFAPFKVFAPQTSKEAYDTNPFVRALWNTQVSLGTAKPADSNDTSLKAGLGIYSVLYRSKASDPLRDMQHRGCLASAIRRELEDLKQGEVGGGGGTDGAGSSSATAVADCYRKLAERTGNGTDVAFALATSRFSESGKWSDGRRDAHGGWLSASYGFEGLREGFPMLNDIQATFALKRLLDETVKDSLDDNAKVRQSSWLLGAKLLWHTQSFNYFVEHSYRRLQVAGREEDKVRRSALGIEWEVSPGLWMVGAIGGEGGRTNGKDQSFITTGIKWGSSTESTLRAR